MTATSKFITKTTPAYQNKKKKEKCKQKQQILNDINSLEDIDLKQTCKI